MQLSPPRYSSCYLCGSHPDVTLDVSKTQNPYKESFVIFVVGPLNVALLVYFHPTRCQHYTLTHQVAAPRYIVHGIL